MLAFSLTVAEGISGQMATFLLKVNCELHLNGAEPRPNDASQWEGRTVSFLRPRTLENELSNGVTPGDTIIIWTHEHVDFGKGLGLTATATAGSVTSHAKASDAIMLDVQLVKPHARLDSLPGGSTGSELLDSLSNNRHHRTVAMSDLQASEFWEALGAAGRRKQALIAAYAPSVPKSDGEMALQEDRHEIAEGLERRFASVEVRPDQAAFRRSLMRLYQGRCLVSGNRIGAVLQAAHIVPFSEGIQFRNEVCNGLLLRADLHILFDKSLIAINTVRNRVVIAADLKGTVYEQFEGRLVRHHAKPEFLRRQHQEFLSRLAQAEA